MTSNLRFRALLVLALALGCSPAPAQTAPDLPGFRVLAYDRVDDIHQMHVAYRSGPHQVHAFVFLPATLQPRPLVVFNHGGVSGVSEDMKWRSRDLVRAGYVVITPAYRGEGGSEGNIEVAKGEVDDVIVATRLMLATPYVRREAVVAVGSSHGALISMLAAARQPQLYAGVAAACGVMDVETWYHWLVEHDFDVKDSLTVAIYGQGPQDRPQAFADRKAVTRAQAIQVPVLLQYGSADRIVPVEQGTAMAAALARAGNARVLLATYPLLGHAFWFWEIAYHSQAEVDEANVAWGDMVGFLAGCCQNR